MGDPACTEPGFITQDKKSKRGLGEGMPKNILFAPVYMSEYEPSILQTVDDNMTLTTTMATMTSLPDVM